MLGRYRDLLLGLPFLKLSMMRLFSYLFLFLSLFSLFFFFSELNEMEKQNQKIKIKTKTKKHNLLPRILTNFSPFLKSSKA